MLPQIGKRRIKGKVRLRTLADLDMRSRSSRLARGIIVGLINDLGGPSEVTVAQRQLIQRAAVLAAMLEHYETEWAANKTIPLADYMAVVNAQRRILLSLGLERRARNVTPNGTLADYIRKKPAQTKLIDDNDGDA